MGDPSQSQRSVFKVYIYIYVCVVKDQTSECQFYQFCFEERWYWWSDSPALSCSCLAPELDCPGTPTHSAGPENKPWNIMKPRTFTFQNTTFSFFYCTPTLSCCTLLCRLSVLRLGSLAGSCSCAICSHLRRDPERERNSASCWSQFWVAFSLYTD